MLLAICTSLVWWTVWEVTERISLTTSIPHSLLWEVRVSSTIYSACILYMNSCTHIRILDMLMWTHRGHEDIPCIQHMHWPGGMKEYWTALLLMRLPSMLYTHWMMYPSRACTLPTPLILTLCFVLLWTEYIAPGKAVPKSWPLSNVPLCIQFGSVGTSLCLQMRVSWSEQRSPWSSRETLKTAVRWQQQGIYESKAQESVATLYTVCSQGLKYMYSAYNTSYCKGKVSASGSNGGRYRQLHCPYIRIRGIGVKFQNTQKTDERAT